MKPKILIIGQALPAVVQSLPYDTTMLYEWLAEIGVTKEASQSLFSFEAVFGSFTGFDEHGGHLKPTQEQMDSHWDAVLQTKVELADKIWVLGNVARQYLETKPKTWSCNTEWLYTIHPSKRNYNLYQKNKQKIINSIREFVQ